METNEINNAILKRNIADSVIQLLLTNKLVSDEDLKSCQLEFGYVFSKSDGVTEALLKTICNLKEFYFAIQNNSLQLININKQQYDETISYMKANHECLKSTYESEAKKNRRLKNNQYLVQNNISISENLECRIDDDHANLKSIDDICRRAIACLITVQIACDINQGNYEESLEFFSPVYNQFGVMDALNEKEKRIINGTYTTQDPIDMDWAYEAYWALCWCLGLIDDIKDASMLCDCDTAISLVTSCKTFDEFKNKCKLRNIDEILDMHDLYYRYNWAINNKIIDDRTSIGDLNPSNVIERRRALEWVFSSQDDWYSIPLDA